MDSAAPAPVSSASQAADREPAVADPPAPPPSLAVGSITRRSVPHLPPRMPSRAAIVTGSSLRPALASAGSLAPVVSALDGSVTMPSPGAPAPAPVPSFVDPIGVTTPALTVPPEVRAASGYVPPAPASSTPAAYERAFRRWSQPNFDVPVDVPSDEPLSYHVYTPEALSSLRAVTASAPSERAPLPRPSLAVRLGASAIGIACVLGVALVALVATSDEPSASRASAQAAAAPLAVVEAVPTPVPVAPALAVAPAPLAPAAVAPAPLAPAAVAPAPLAPAAVAPASPESLAPAPTGKLKAAKKPAAVAPVVAPNPYEALAPSKPKKR